MCEAMHGGQVEVTISQGRVVWEYGALKVRLGAGRFIHLPTGGPLFVGLDRLDASRQQQQFPYGPVPVWREELEDAPPKDEL